MLGEHNINWAVFHSLAKYMIVLPIKIPIMKLFIMATLKIGTILLTDISGGATYTMLCTP